MFAAIFDASGRPIEIGRFGLGQPGGFDVRVPPAATNVAFIVGRSGYAGTTETHLALPATGPIGVVGRIRLDRKTELRARLGATDDLSDTDLVGLAHERWGEACTEHLAGDFCFVTLDLRQRQLVAARDQLGVRALYYTRLDGTWLISDSLDWLAGQRPDVPELDDYWIADFLTLGFCREFERTIYRDIHRLPPGHSLRLGAGEAAPRRYWRLEIDEPLYLKRTIDYGERFRDLVKSAIADRLPGGTVGIAMSGGLDSTTLAALAVEHIQDASRVVAECLHYEHLMDIGEDHYAALAAHHLGIELKVRPFDELVYDRSWRDRNIRSAEPTKSLLDAHHLRAVGLDRSRRAEVWFEGEGPDNALDLERAAYLGWLRRQRSWSRLGATWLQYAKVKGLSGWKQSLRRHLQPDRFEPQPPDIPPWLDRGLIADLKLRQRAEALNTGGDTSHAWHPQAFASFTSPIWQHYFGQCDFEETLAPVRTRHPYLDLRVLEFMLRVPPIPWGWKKQLVRYAMHDRLPRPILEREKTPLALHPDVALARREGIPALAASDRLRRFVDVARLPDPSDPPAVVHRLFAVHALDTWLETRGS